MGGTHSERHSGKSYATRGKLDPIRLKDGRAGTFFHLPSIVPPDRYKMTKELTKKLQNLARKKCWPIIL